jgi:hypothetical protein
MIKFKAGDKVKCVDNSLAKMRITEGKEYVVTSCDESFVYLLADDREAPATESGWHLHRFELVEADPEFAVGDIVRISSDSEYYGTGLDNPRDVDGTVIDTFVNGSFPIVVEWETGQVNSYRQSDLVPSKPSETEKLREKLSDAITTLLDFGVFLDEDRDLTASTVVDFYHVSKVSEFLDALFEQPTTDALEIEELEAEMAELKERIAYLKS